MGVTNAKGFKRLLYHVVFCLHHIVSLLPQALTPTRNVYDLRNRTVVCQPDLNLDQSIEMETGEEGICNEAPPAAMVENAHEALREEIQALQVWLAISEKEEA